MDSDDDNSDNLIAKGRWVSTYDLKNGYSRRPVRPRFGKPVSELNSIETLLRQISGQEQIDKLTLLVAPTSKPNVQKMHCFDYNIKKHLGSCCITTSELDLFKQYELFAKYELVFTDEHLPIKSVCDSTVTSQLIGNKNVSLIERGSVPAIKSLRQPKIPVRMRVVDMIRLQKNLTYKY